jgi:hypothetical protein
LSRGFLFLDTPKHTLVLGEIRKLRLVAEQLQEPIQD